MSSQAPTWRCVLPSLADAQQTLEEVLVDMGMAGASGDVPPTFLFCTDSMPAEERAAQHVVVIGTGDEASLEASDWANDYWVLPLRPRLVELRLRRTLDGHRDAEQVAEQEAKFENLIFNIPGIVYRCEFDRGWTMQYISESVRNVTGYPPHEFTDGTRDYGSIMVEEDRERVDAEVAAAMEANEAFYLEYRILRADGEERWVGSRGRGVRMASGELKYLDGAIFDISDEKQVQAELERHRGELARTIKDLKRIDALRTRMFQNVSHELRTPLALILAPAQRLLLEAEETYKRPLSSIMRNGYRLLDQINALLDVAKMEATGLPVHTVAMSVGDFLTQLIDDVRPAADERGIALSFHADSPAIYELDPRHMERIVLNLLSNALKFTPSGGAIDVAVSTQGGLGIAVRDTGPGIAPEEQSKIFERFVQAEGETAIGGTGIGLALVLELSRRMGGDVGLRSTPGEGAEFTLRFPETLRRSAETDHAARPKEDAASMGELSRRARYEALRGASVGKSTQRRGDRGPRILVVEDNLEMNALISEILAARFQVISVFSAEEALELLGDLRPAAIVSDVSMPGMDGVEFARRLRERPDFREVGIVLLSAHADVEDRVRGRQVGVDAYLTKPFHPSELMASVEGIVRSRLHLVGDYQVHESLGSGGQGSVFLAESPSGRFVALKLISHGSLVDRSSQERLSRELAVLQQIEHPNIVRIVEDGRSGDVAYVAMEYLDGANLEQILESNGPCSDAEITTLLLGVCRGVHAIHQEGVLHRDLKCDNVMVLRDGARGSGAVRIVDFGLASEETSVSPAGGTLPYLAPELRLSGEASQASEVYAIGVMGFRLLTKQYPTPENRGELPRSSHRTWIQRALAEEASERITLEELLAALALLPSSDLPKLPPASQSVRDLAVTE